MADRLVRALNSEDAILDLPGASMEEVCTHMLSVLVERGRISETAVPGILEGLLEREASGSTAIGHSVAIPHVYIDGVDAPIVQFARCENPLDLGAPDGARTRFVFLLLGPRDRAGEHIDTLAAIARLMSDERFRYEARTAENAAEIAKAYQQHQRRTRPIERKKPEAREELSFTRRVFGGLVADLRRRIPYYGLDFRDGLHPKALSSIMFLLFAALAPAVTFGGIMADQTGGAIGAVEMLAATAICGVIYALFGGQPLIILGGTGPLLVITAIIYGICESMGIPFLPTYFWVGMWSALFTLIAAATDLSALMRYFTRFTDEIFAALISIIFIVQAVQALLGEFGDDAGHHEASFLALILGIGCFWVASALFRFRHGVYLRPRVREFLADFGPAIALAAMTLIALGFRENVDLAHLAAPEEFGTTSGRDWLVDPFEAPKWVWLASAGPAILVTILVFLDQNITARIVNSPDHKLRRGSAYHLDLAVVAVLVAVCSAFGLPWLVAATVRSLNHVRSLATTEKRSGPDGEPREKIIHTRENRVTGLAIHLLVGVSLLALPLLRKVPMAVLYGLFLYMGVVSMRGNQFFERLSLWPMDAKSYPKNHYTRLVPMAKIHGFTGVQLMCLVVLWVVKASIVGILFPVFVALLVPIRLAMRKFFKPEHLDALDSEEEPDDEEGEHWI
jgi:mannitol/fructose-specific phosphotransferase system IIA component (Ntr-type)